MSNSFENPFAAPPPPVPEAAEPALEETKQEVVSDSEEIASTAEQAPVANPVHELLAANNISSEKFNFGVAFGPEDLTNKWGFEHNAASLAHEILLAEKHLHSSNLGRWGGLQKSVELYGRLPEGREKKAVDLIMEKARVLNPTSPEKITKGWLDLDWSERDPAQPEQ